MRRTISPIIFVCLVATLVSCSHPQVRDASQVDAEEHAALLEGVCGEAAEQSSCTSCPSFLGVDSEGALAFERVLYGSFSYSTADEALVEVSGCGEGPSVVALERRDDRWHRFGWQPNISLGECEQVELEDATTGLVCRIPPSEHGDNFDRLKKLAVVNGKLEYTSLFYALGPTACDAPSAGYFRRIDHWHLTSDNSAVEFTVGWYCQRTMPHENVCESKRAGVAPLRQASQQRRELDWSYTPSITIGDFCDRVDVVKVLHATAPKLEKCVALGGEDARTGRYIPQWKVGLDGGVLENSPFLHEAPTDNPAVTDCFEQVLSQMQFEEPDGGICIINYAYFFLNGEHWKNACSSFDPPPLEWLEKRER